MPRRIPCDLPGHEGEWIERIDRVPKKFWDAWKKADSDATQQLFSTFLTNWNLTDAFNKSMLPPSQGIEILEDMDVAILPWLVDAVTKSVLEDMRLLPNKSSSSPIS